MASFSVLLLSNQIQSFFLSSANLKLDHQELRQDFSLPVFFSAAFMAFHTIPIPVRPLFQTGHFEEGPNCFMNWVMKTVEHLQ